MWTEILGEDIYRMIDKEYCRLLVEKEEKLLRQGIQGELLQLFQSNQLYYREPISKVNFESFFRFFIQIGIDYIERNNKNRKILYTNRTENLAINIVKAIVKIPMRCLIYEIHERKKCGKLKGTTAQQEYIYYETAYLQNPEYIRNLCRKYPEMLRLILLRIGQVIEETNEISKYLEEDQSFIEEKILGNKFCKISKILLGKSDTHHGGHTVAEIEVENGQKIIYRPNDIEKNKIYFQMYDWLMVGSGLDASYRKLLSYQTHSWEEYVKYKFCQNDQEVKNYFFRSGILLFLCYLTYSTDIHGENIISNGEYPEIIDLETMPGHGKYKNSIGEKKSDDFAQFSVLQTGFLPMPAWGESEGENFPSGLHTNAIIKTKIKIPTICNPYSSKIEMGHKDGTIHLEKSIVRKGNQTIKIQEYIDEICEGFNHAYRRTLNRKEEIITLLSELDRKKSRYLIRHTQQYDMYLNTSFFPEFMKKTENRIYFFYVLKKNRKQEEYSDAFFKSELSALLNFDIPIYYSNVQNNELQPEKEECSRKKEEHDMRRYMNRLSEDDLFRQILLIRMALGYNLPEVNNSRYIKLDEKFKTPLDMANNLGKILMKWKSKEADCTSYQGLKIYVDKWRIETIDMSLYNGISGLAVSFALLGVYTGNALWMKECKNLSEKMYDYTDKIVRKVRKSESNQTGMYDGEGSIVYGYLILYEILKQPQYLKYARKHMQIVNDLVLKDENYDLLSGNAGWIIVLMKFYEITKDKTILNYAIRVEKELWKHRTVLLNGIGWIQKKEKVILSGISHGNSGMILAYSYLLKNTRKKIYKKRIDLLLNYEDSLYSEIHENWRDFRKEKTSCYLANTWCHGGSGILLSRLSLVQLREYKNNSIVKRDIERGLQCLSKWKGEERLCICHGLSGVYLIFKACAKSLNNPKYLAEAEEVREKILIRDKMTIKEFGDLAFMSGIGGIICVLYDDLSEIIW